MSSGFCGCARKEVQTNSCRTGRDEAIIERDTALVAALGSIDLRDLMRSQAGWLAGVEFTTGGGRTSRQSRNPLLE
jgi:hypothetical protein